jgi:hypothetical protein
VALLLEKYTAALPIFAPKFVISYLRWVGLSFKSIEARSHIAIAHIIFADWKQHMLGVFW